MTKRKNESDCCAPIESDGCCGTQSNNDSYNQYIDLSYCTTKLLKTANGDVAVIQSALVFKDKIGAYKVRWDIKRNKYRIKPNIYAIGTPNDTSPVFVSANYKLSFDAVRCALADIDAWILVIDTKGVNVWCAAGKGTFGTAEIIEKIQTFNLQKLVSHRKIILPQLSAPGVAAHKIAKDTGFKAIYGPVRAQDIKAFLTNNMTSNDAMRAVNFTFKDRLVLTPVEVMVIVKYIPLFYLFFVIYNMIGKDGFVFLDVLYISFLNTLPFIGAMFIGAVVVPLILPILPFRAFALKGLFIGIIWSAVCILLYSIFALPESFMFITAMAILICIITSYLSLNFTGSTTYTSFTGAALETKITFPLAIGLSIVAVIAVIVVKILEIIN